MAFAIRQCNARDYSIKRYRSNCNRFLNAFPEEIRIIIKKTFNLFLDLSWEDAMKYETLERSFRNREFSECKKWKEIYFNLRLMDYQEEFLNDKEEITQRFNMETAEEMIDTWSQFRNRDVLMSYIDFLCDKKSLGIGYHYFTFFNPYSCEMEEYADSDFCAFFEFNKPDNKEKIYTLRSLFEEVIDERIEFHRQRIIRLKKIRTMIRNRMSYRKTILNRGM